MRGSTVFALGKRQARDTVAAGTAIYERLQVALPQVGRFFLLWLSLRLL